MFLGSMHKRSADVQTYNPGERSALLGKGPRASVTHYTQVSGAQVGRTAAKVNNMSRPYFFNVRTWRRFTQILDRQVKIGKRAILKWVRFSI